MDHFDFLIIGGGAAGMMAAISAKRHHPDFSVAIVDGTFELGRKFLTSGAGRGNLTNMNLKDGLGDHFHGDQAFISHVFSQFSYADTIKFFENLGVPTYEEKKTGKGKIFPVIDNARTVRNMFVDVLKEAGVSVFCNAGVTSVEKTQEGWIVKTNAGDFVASRILLSAGGKTYPALGGDGTGYEIARALGHTIITPVVSAVPVVSKNPLSQILQGEKTVMKVTAIIEGKNVAEAVGDVMFTQYGFSGPAIFDISREFSICINREGKRDTKIRLSFFPDKTRDDISTLLKNRFAKHPTFPVANTLWGLLTEKSAGGVCAVAHMSKEKIASEMNDGDTLSLVTVLTGFEADVEGTRGWNEAEFTAGGVLTADIDPTSMQSKIVSGLYFAGEIINVDGQVGGFNLSWAWSTGWIAGKLL